MQSDNLEGRFALDMGGLQRLKHSARSDPQEGLRQAAEQFEAVLLNRMLKSMREATPESGLMDSQQTRFYESLFDQQLSQHLAGKGVGLADQLVRELEGSLPRKRSGEDLIAGIPRGEPRPLTGTAPSSPSRSTPANNRVAESGPDTSAEASRPTPPLENAGDGDHSRQTFVDNLREPALAAAGDTGVPAELIIAQAALETGWGSHRILADGGRESHNLFGIKAGSQWQGETTDVTTHEYRDGRRVPATAEFRVYESLSQALTDYGDLLRDNPRYRNVVAATTPGDAAQALQSAGYATDPDYADKLKAVMADIGPVGQTAELASNDAASPENKPR